MSEKLHHEEPEQEKPQESFADRVIREMNEQLAQTGESTKKEIDKIKNDGTAKLADLEELRRKFAAGEINREQAAKMRKEIKDRK